MILGRSTLFLVVKYFEYAAKIHHGLVPVGPNVDMPWFNAAGGTSASRARIAL